MNFPWPLRMILLLSILSVISLGYLATHLILISKRKKHSLKRFSLIGFTILFLLLSFIYPISGVVIELSGGAFNYADFPRWLIYSFWFGMASGVTMVNFLLLADLSSLFARFVFHTDRSKSRSLKEKFILISLALVLIYSAFTMYSDTQRMEVTHNEVKMSGTDKTSKPADTLRITHISDIQADRFTTPEKMNRYIDKVNETEPDIVVFTGDLVTSGINYFDEGAETMARIKSTLGVYSVMGDHDFWSSDELFRSSLKRENSHFLDDSVTQIQHKNLTVALAGITEIYSQRISNEHLRILFSDSLMHNSDLSLVISHQVNKRIVEASETSGTVDIILGGHTHGGQIALPFLYQLWNPSTLETPFNAGSYRVGDLFINVNVGLGFTLTPVRYHVPAEVSVIDVIY